MTEEGGEAIITLFLLLCNLSPFPFRKEEGEDSEELTNRAENSNESDKLL